ncbi:MAG: tRNA-dihydrouridine synthase [bacterium]
MNNFWQRLNKPIVGLAPMDGVTDVAMRHTFSRSTSPDVIFTEQVSVEAVVQAFSEIRDRLQYSKIGRPVVAQLSGYDPAYYYPAAKKVLELGFDGIDINLGCPVKAFNKKGGRRGAGLIGEYETVEKVVVAVRKAIDDSGAGIPLSVKTRTGIKKHQTEEWVGFLADLPVDAIILHGRTFKQGYTGKADWDEIAKGAKIAHRGGKIFLGNGDVGSRGKAEKLCQKYGTDGVLIGRAARGNPWVFCKDDTSTMTSTTTIRIVGVREKRINTLLEHAKYFEKVRGRRPFVEFRKHIGWYLKGFAGAKALRSRLILVENLPELKKGLAG